jgi:hypothetical protein
MGFEEGDPSDEPVDGEHFYNTSEHIEQDSYRVIIAAIARLWMVSR